MQSDQDAALARIDDAQAALRRMLTGVEPSRLRQRPPSDEWSPMEHVRHLIFAEQHHFKPLLPRGFRWSSAGVPPPNKTGERRLSPIGSDLAGSIDDVFDGWAKVHAVVRTICSEAGGDVTDMLNGDLRHLVTHTAAIERLLRG